jgi:monothiol glutaredoxin
MALSETVRQQLTDLVGSHPVVLFMKGNRQFPQCGFSAQVVQILNGLVPKYQTVNVLADPAVREGIKEFSQWPTIPQLYVGGQFVGGCDIVKDLYASGELKELLGKVAAAGPEAAAAPRATAIGSAPRITISDRAAAAFRGAEEGDGDRLRLEIGPQFQYDLFFAPASEGDLEVVSNGITLRLDAASAARADGLSIDFVEGGGGGFRIVSPHEPPRVKPLRATELKQMLDAGTPIELFDVRTDAERAIARIPGARPLDEQAEARLADLDKDAVVVFHCHHGMRSQNAAQRYLQQGFRNLYNLEGGIDAWSSEVDPKVPRY